MWQWIEFMTKLTAIENSNADNKLFGLDHLRALAIVLVFLYHFGRLFPHPQWTNTISRFGWSGVDLFFVLSGYLIASQLFAKIVQEKQIVFKDFFIKRFFRIIPAYLVVVALYFSFQSFREREALAPLWKYLTFTQNIGLDVRKVGTFSHAWSLCIEEQFYLFLPLTLIALVYYKLIKKGYIVLLLLFIFGFLARIYSWYTLVLPFKNGNMFFVNWFKWIYYPTYCRFDGLITGVSIAAVYQFKTKHRERLNKYGNQLILASLIVLAGAYYVCFDERTFIASVYGFPLVALGYGILVMGAVSPGSILYKYKSSTSTNVAVLSYGIYLTHKMIIHLTQDGFTKLNIAKDSNLMFVICVITSVSAALLLNRIIEKPFLRLRDVMLKVNKSVYKIGGVA
jgi:peptidoglycan/LPS O-acetylase OafA/YrhL